LFASDVYHTSFNNANDFVTSGPGFLQCFDTVGFVIWPVTVVPEMTYNVLNE